GVGRTVFRGAENQGLASSLLCPAPISTFPAAIQATLDTADPVVGLRGRKAPSSMGKISTAEVLRLRATSAVSRDQSVRRSAQDDDSVGVLTRNLPRLA